MARRVGKSADNSTPEVRGTLPTVYDQVNYNARNPSFVIPIPNYKVNFIIIVFNVVCPVLCPAAHLFNLSEFLPTLISALNLLPFHHFYCCI